MTARPPGPGEAPWHDELAGRRASLTALWALALERFRDYLQWATGSTGDHQTGETADGPPRDQGEAHDCDR